MSKGNAGGEGPKDNAEARRTLSFAEELQRYDLRTEPASESGATTATAKSRFSAALGMTVDAIA